MTAAVAGPQAPARGLVVALVGNPNCGKTTLFNGLTGLRQKVGNYPGVTVEKKEGRTFLKDGRELRLIDLPGLYSLTPHSPDEVIAREVLLGLRGDTPRPDIIVNVVDASNLERNLYLTSQLLDIGLPVVIALTMTDTAAASGVQVDVERLASQLKLPICAVVASRRQGLDSLLSAIGDNLTSPAPEPVLKLSAQVDAAVAELRAALQEAHGLSERAARAEAAALLMQENEHAPTERLTASVRTAMAATRERLLQEEIDIAAHAIEARYNWIAQATAGTVTQRPGANPRRLSLSDRIDRVVLHPFWGYVLFVLVMSIVFQSIFAIGQANGPSDLIKRGVGALGDLVSKRMAEGDLKDLIVTGILGGVGTTIAFLPQILALFLFVSLLEDTGYMARAAFLVDKLMSKVGLHGKSFIPLLSSFACAIPGVMATRTIGDRKARLITILVAPLMSCSARLPVYLLMIGAFVPNRPLITIGRFPLLTLPGATLIAMYFLGMGAAFGIAWLFHRTLLRGVAPTFLLEMPPYRLPSLRTAAFQMFERAMLFIKRAATIILAVSVVVWFLSTHPRIPDASPDRQLSGSYLGTIGKVIEPALRPLGFDWKIGVGIASSFIAREVFVSTMGTVYNVKDAEDQGQSQLAEKMQRDIDPRSGRPVFNPLIAVCLMIYYVLAMQCMSTVAVVRRETNGWKWPLFQLMYMSLLAWVVTFVVYHVGLLLHLGLR